MYTDVRLWSSLQAVQQSSHTYTGKQQTLSITSIFELKLYTFIQYFVLTVFGTP